MIVVLVFLVAGTQISSQIHYRNTRSDAAEIVEKDYNALDFAVEDSKDDLIVDTYRESETSALPMLYIYDADYLDLFFDYASVSGNELKTAVKNNDGISKQYKELLYWYIDAVTEKYPSADLRPFYYNL